VETSELHSTNYQALSLAELYDLLAEETIKFNKKLLEKTSKDQFKDLKKSIREIQDEIIRRKANSVIY
jgi:hypothetical protein